MISIVCFTEQWLLISYNLCKFTIDVQRTDVVSTNFAFHADASHLIINRHYVTAPVTLILKKLFTRFSVTTGKRALRKRTFFPFKEVRADKGV
jgi:hypothetical protein